MCRLLGIIANKPVDLRFSLIEGPKTLRAMAVTNPDGWGLGWYDEEGNPVVHKEPITAEESWEYERAAEGWSRIFIAHVRRATTGELSRENCHPFQSGRWLFAHNGSVHDHESLRRCLSSDREAAIQGQTDSEVFFQWLLQSIETCGSVLQGLQAALAEIRNYSALNFLLTNGKELYAYRDASQRYSYYTLYYLVRDPTTCDPITFRSREVAMLLKSKALQGERAVLVCSEQLTGEPWEEVPLGYLLRVGQCLKPELVRVK